MSGPGKGGDDDKLDDNVFVAWVAANAAEETPPPGARARLLEAVAGVGRFAPLQDAVSRLTDLASDALSTLLRRVDEPDGWIDGPPSVRYFHFSPGPAAAAPEAGIVRMRPGAAFPRHRHLGDEFSLVLDGILIDDAGDRHGPGSLISSAAGSEHAYAAGPGRDLLLVSMHGGVAFTDPDSFQLQPNSRP